MQVLRSIPALIVLAFLIVLGIWKFGDWFDSAANKALNQPGCTKAQIHWGLCDDQIKIQLPDRMPDPGSPPPR